MAYIVQITGTSGTGKTTLLPHLKERIKTQGYSVEDVKEPDKLREFAKLYRLRGDKDPLVETAVFSIDRLITYTQKIAPRINESNLVFLSERGLFDNFVYQGFLGGVDIETIKRLNTHIPHPNLTICLVVDGAEGNRRVLERLRSTNEPLSQNETPERIELLGSFYRSLPTYFPEQKIKIIDTTSIDNEETTRLCFDEVRRVLK